MTPLMLLVAGALLLLSIVAPEAADALVLPTLGLLVVYMLLPARVRGDDPSYPRRRKRDRVTWLDALVAFAALSVCVAGPFVYVDLAGKIQDERVRNVRQNCVDTNERNAKTKARIRELARPRTERAAKETEERLKATFLIIDALAPVRPDCEAVVRQQVPSAFD